MGSSVSVPAPEPCPIHDSSLSNFDYVLAWCLFLFTFVAYIPQLAKQWRMNSHFGMSFETTVMGNLVTTLGQVNFMCLSWRSTFACCADDVPFRDCIGSYLVFNQITSVWVCVHMLTVFYFWCYDKALEWEKEERNLADGERALLPMARVPGSIPKALRRAWRGLWIVILIEVGLFAAPVVLAWQYGGVDGDMFRWYGVVTGLIATVLVCIRWLPQIWLTFTLRKVGVLSIPTLVMLSGGSYLTAYNLTTHGGWELWLRFVVVATLQALIVVEAIVFRWCTCCLDDLKTERDQHGQPQETDSESEDFPQKLREDMTLAPAAS